MFKHIYTHTNANTNAIIYKWMKFVERKAKCDVLCKEHKLLIIMTYQHKVETSFQSFQTNLFWWWKIYFFFEVREKIDAVNKNIFFFFSFDLFNGMMHFNIYLDKSWRAPFKGNLCEWHYNLMYDEMYVREVAQRWNYLQSKNNDIFQFKVWMTHFTRTHAPFHYR